MRNLLKKIMAHDGVIAIEFSFIYIIFIAFVFIIFEACKFLFILSAMDYSLSEAARKSAYVENKTTSFEYGQVFDEYFFNQNKFWVVFIDPKDIQVKANFCSTVNELVKGKCSSVYNNNKRLALFSVSYKYRPFSAISSMKWSESLFSSLDSYLTRKVVYMIES